MNQPLKWHGGKHYLAEQIVALMPQHTHYVEPYAGGLAVLLTKPCEGISEVVNDLHQDLTNFWRVLQNRDLFRCFRRRVQATPFSQPEWDRADELLGKVPISREQRVERAVRFFVLCRQSLAGRCEDFATLSRNRTRRGMNEQVSAWIRAVDGLPSVHARLRRVVVLNRPALDVIRSQDGPETLFYLDPPYMPETKTSQSFGPLEMSVDQHAELLDTILRCRAKVMLSGYPSSLYDTRLEGWSRHEFKLPNHAASGALKRYMNEILWCNFVPTSKERAHANGRHADRTNPVPV
jgi:DNA adenine methylase